MGIDLREISASVPERRDSRADVPVLTYAPATPTRAILTKWLRRIGWSVAVLAVLLALYPVIERGLGYCAGAAEARRELSQNRATIYVSGYRNPIERFDPTTGLPTKAVAGCMVRPWSQGLQNGHNSVIESHIRQHGPPAYSRAAWSGQISAISRHVESQPASSRVSLSASGAVVRSPDGRFALSLSSWSCRPGDYCSPPPLVLSQLGGGRTTVTLPTMAFCVSTEVDVVWGETGSDIAFLRFKGALTRFRSCVPPLGEDVYYAILDLRDGAWLRGE